MVSVSIPPLSADEIRNQTARLHALARRLAVASADADDAIQQTWMQTLQRGLPHPRALAAFLATTLRNVIAFTGRTRRRRSAREEAAVAARPLEFDSTADLVATVELHRHLASLVLELPPTQREFVLRHYFAGDSIEELAIRHATTPAAVRGHLHRAREQLRTRLEASEGEPRRGFALLVGAAAQPAVPVLLTVLAMNTKSLVTAAAVLVVGLLLWHGLAPGALPAVVPAGQDKAVAVAASVDLSAPASNRSGADDRTAVGNDVDASWVVRGEVMHGSVAPLPGGSFTARLFAGWEASGEPLFERTVVADAQGAFELALPPVREVVSLHFVQQRADTKIMASARTFAPGDEPPQDVMIFAFVADCRVTGAVTDEAGRPVEGAWVKLGRDDEAVRCAPDGAFRVMASATYGDVSLLAGAPGYAPAKRNVNVQDRAAGAEASFRLKPGTRLFGRVVDTAGAPVPDARVHTGETWSCPARSDQDGRFELHLDAQQERHTAYVSHEGYLETQSEFATARLGEPCEIVLQRGQSVRGRVTDRLGRPVVGAQVRFGEWIGYLGALRARSADDGTFEIRTVPPGRGAVSVFARGFAPVRTLIEVGADGSNTPEVAVQLEPGHRIAGRIVDRDGVGLHRVRVTPIVGGPSGRWQPGSDVYTARDGTFRLANLPAGSVALDCFGVEVARKEEPDVAVDRDDVTIVMDRPAGLAGRVVDDATGAPIPRFVVRFVDPELQPGDRRVGGFGVEWVRGLSFADTDGVWRTGIERFDVGAVLGVEVLAEGYASAVQRRVIAQVKPDPSACEMRLKKATRIVGRVVDARTGSAIVDARVAVFDDDHPLFGRDPFADARTAARTGVDGGFVIEGSSVGAVRLVVRHPDWPVTFDGPFTTAPGAEATRTVAVQAGACIRGTALDANGNAVVEASIMLAQTVIEGLRIPESVVRTDRNGRFELPRLLAGTYTLYGNGHASDGSIAVWGRVVEVAADRVHEVELVPPGDGAIEVEITGEGLRAGDVHVQISPATQEWSLPFFQAVARGATFVVRGLPTGKAEVRVSALDGGPSWMGTASVDIAGKQPTRVRIASARSR